MCGLKLMDKRSKVELIDMLGLKKAVDMLAKVNGMRWYSHVLRRPEKDALLKAMVHEVDEKRSTGLTKDEMEGAS